MAPRIFYDALSYYALERLVINVIYNIIGIILADIWKNIKI